MYFLRFMAWERLDRLMDRQVVVCRGGDSVAVVAGRVAGVAIVAVLKLDVYPPDALVSFCND